MIQLDELLAAGGALHGPASAITFTDCAYDSRLTAPGELFLALRTPRADGHDYIAAALAAGATGLLCTWPPVSAGQTTVVVADDPLAVLQRWAAQRLRTVAPTVVAVTGSVGKTSTRHAITALLQAHAPTFGSRRSFNSLLGLPVTLAQLENHHRYAVLEFGSDHPGEIAHLAALFPPQVAVVTNVGDTHLRTFGSRAAVAKEKAALVAALPGTGWAVLNGDDARVVAMRDRTAAQVLLFGQGDDCDLRATKVRYAATGTTMELRWRDETATATTVLLGEPAVYVALAAVATALACGCAFAPAVEALALVQPLAGRLRLLPGQGGALLLDDSFNAQPPAVAAALRTLAALPARRRIAVLGQLGDVPANSAAIYRDLGLLAGTIVDQLICKGEWSEQLVRAAHEAQPDLPTMIVHTARAARQALPSDLGPADLVLVKGSAEARMERVVAQLVDHAQVPSDALVRQEAAWRSVRVGVPDRPTWLRIDLDMLAHNMRRLREIAQVPLMVVLKADAYGHGAVRVARVALANGATMLAVATLGEARALRQAGITAPVLVLGYTPPWQAQEAVLLDVTCTVFDDDTAQALATAAADVQRRAAVHVKVDTGMARLGLAPDAVAPFLRRLSDLPTIAVAGLYTHFATADEADEDFARTQLARFEAVLAAISAAGLRPPLVHAANSAALLRFPAAHFDMARPGIACYGLAPSAATPLPTDMQPVLSFHSEVAQVKHHAAGTPLSYGGTFITSRPSTIATIPVGYADGLRRSPPWQALLVSGQRVPIVGRICMDYALVDVTDVGGVKRGDAVVLIGRQGDECITADEIAGWLGTINYEVVASILPRVPREVEE